MSQTKQCIVVVDDGASEREFVTRILNDAQAFDATILQAKDGSEALNLILNNTVDVVISDMMMPNVNGIELLRNLRTQFSFETLPFIMLTSNDREADRALSFGLGVNDFVQKPVSPQELVRRVLVQLRLRSLQLELSVKESDLHLASSTDPGSGALTRGGLVAWWNRELERSKRFPGIVGMWVARLDSEGQLRKQLGETPWAEFQERLIPSIVNSLRRSDACARISPQHIAVCVRETDRDAIEACFFRTNQELQEHPPVEHLESAISLSAGAVASDTTTSDGELALSLAFRALETIPASARQSVVWDEQKDEESS